MKCPNSFTCAGCNKEYHHRTPLSQRLEEHEQRKKDIPDYDDGEESIEVCDACFKNIFDN